MVKYPMLNVKLNEWLQIGLESSKQMQSNLSSVGLNHDDKETIEIVSNITSDCLIIECTLSFVAKATVIFLHQMLTIVNMTFSTLMNILYTIKA